MKKLLVTLMIAGCALMVPTQAEAVLYFDDTFAPADWSLFTETLANGGSVTPSQVLAGGNPDAYRRIDHVVASGAAGSGVWGFHYNNNAVYDPGVSGAIIDIDYMEDAIVLQPNGGQGQATGPALRQNGKNYFVIGTITGDSQAWHNIAINDSDSAAFRTLGSSVDHPDFSASADPILFGFYRANSTGGTLGYTLNAGIDNWKVETNVVPEPATMILFGSGLLGAAFTRRKRKA